MPSHIHRHSGRIIALPAIAASTWSQMPWRAATAAMAATGSIAVVAVVPDGRDDGAGEVAVGDVGGDHRSSSASARIAYSASNGTSAQVVAAEAGEQRALVDRAVRVRRHIDARRARLAL